MKISSVSTNNAVYEVKTKPVTQVDIDALRNRQSRTGVDNAGLDKSANAKSIMQKYDLHNASYDDVKKLARDLHDAGVISNNQWADLTAPIFDEFDKNMNLTTKRGDKYDYVSGTQKMLEYAKNHQTSDFSTIFHLEKLANLIANLDAL